jgi:hypothetical protein
MNAIATDLRYALSPTAFARESLSLEPDQWQANVLNSSARQLALCCSRQAGKSTITSVLAAHTAVYTPESLTVLISPSLRQSGELFKKVVGMLKIANSDLEQDSATSCMVRGGGRVVSLPGNENTIRGFSSVTLAIFDEAAFASDDVYRALRPMLAVSQGRLILLSTPNGQRGFFYDAWTASSSDWQKISVPAAQCPRIAPAFLESERRALGEFFYSQEYQCVFLESVSGVFRSDAIANAFDTGEQPWRFS